MLLTLLALFLTPDLTALGSDEWTTRDAASKRLAGTTRGALVGLVASRSTDHEVRLRGRLLSRTPVRWLDVQAVLFLTVDGPCTLAESDEWLRNHYTHSAIRIAAKRLGLTTLDAGYDWVWLEENRSNDERYVWSFWIDDLRHRARHGMPR